MNSDEERRAVHGFLRLCSSIFTLNEMDELNQEDMQRVVNEIIDGKTTMDDLKALSASELYDHIIGQGRLFQ